MKSTSFSLVEALKKITSGQDLAFEETYEVAMALSAGTVDPVLAGGLLSALATKGETSLELGGFIKVMRERMLAVPIDLAVLNGARKTLQPAHEKLQFSKGTAPVLVDTCGTGGDGKGTFNVSTLTALVLAGAGVCVAKHGNRSVTSQCGSADLFEALGVNINLSAKQAQTVLEKTGLVFLFARQFHPSMKYIAPVRKILNIRTVFNVLGPLLNPMPVTHQLIGVASESLMTPLAQALVYTPLKGALLVYGLDGLDEITLSEKTRVIEYRSYDATDNGAGRDGITGNSTKPSWNEYILDPRDYGLDFVDSKLLLGGVLAENKDIALQLLRVGSTLKTASPALRAKCNVVALNAAMLMKLAGIVSTVEDGINLATDVIFSGQADKVYRQLVQVTDEVITTA
ncbi:anthranilate phosphoribosyltransferase [Spirochaetota bacterium]|nr:anthranilate phosphoribosyltransferase [Spirochaetota bacterium]